MYHGIYIRKSRFRAPLARRRKTKYLTVYLTIYLPPNENFEYSYPLIVGACSDLDMNFFYHDTYYFLIFQFKHFNICFVCLVHLLVRHCPALGSVGRALDWGLKGC